MNLRTSYIVVLIWLSVIGIPISGQEAEPDTLCTGTERKYQVHPVPGSSYIWLLDDKIIDGLRSNELGIKWNSKGNHIIKVIEESFYGCLGPPQQIKVVVNAPGVLIEVSHSNDGNYNLNCAGDSDAYISVSAEETEIRTLFLWEDGLSGENRTNLSAGIYKISAIDEDGCRTDTTVVLAEPPPISVGHTMRLPFCESTSDGSIDMVVTGGTGEGFYNYLWSGGSTGNTLNDIPAGRYSCVVSDLNGCVATDTILLTAMNISCLKIPEAFSPNGDEINDRWVLGATTLYPGMEVFVYNRWGMEVWRSARGYPVPWDGRSSKGFQLPLDSYHYAIDLHNGTGIIVGAVTIVR